MREPVLALYAFARAADDVADDPNMPGVLKHAALRRLESGLDGASDGAAEGVALRAALEGTPRPACALAEARKLLAAFRQDVDGAAYPDWSALRAYCAHSADPVGRFLLAVHGEEVEAVPPSDALCTALQVLNHCQDLREDRDVRGRVYLPASWLAEAGSGEEALSEESLSAEAREALDRALAECDGLLLEARSLPAAIRDRGLRAQAAATVWLGERLALRLCRGDPLARRVSLSRLDFARAAAIGLMAAAHRPRRDTGGALAA
jgi:phytoene/squalene synthetase